MLSSLTTLIVDIGNFNTRIGYSSDSCPMVDVNSFVFSSKTISEEKQDFSFSHYLCIGKKNSTIESIFNENELESYPNLNSEHFYHFLDSILANEMNLNIEDYSILFSEDVCKFEKEAF